jgi:hypothetical protein
VAPQVLQPGLQQARCLFHTHQDCLFHTHQDWEASEHPGQFPFLACLLACFVGFGLASDGCLGFLS